MESRPTPPDLIGQSPVFLDALAHASAVAEVDRPVLILGERGSGKELLAARIHYLSPRWDGPLIKVNCAAMNEELLESELFGHEAGAFTGATKKHHGRFERADGGTLFLDEIASASLRVQEKLLRVIEYGEYERVGGEETLMADARVIAAANVDLRKRAKDGTFRADLLDRLAFDVVAAPPLRDRREDIALLAGHFAAGMAAELGVPYPGIAPAGLAALQAHGWPGNVRELKNVAERAVFRWAQHTDTAQIEAVVIDPFPDLASPVAERREAVAAPAPHETSAGPIDLRARLDEIEREIAMGALIRADGSQTRAAKALSLTYDQMRGIIRKYDIEPKKLRAG